MTGRFLSKDPSGLSGGLNEYIYGNDNPVNFIDPDGETAVEAADYWANLAGSGYNQGGFGGWWKVQTGNTMGMFINMWHAQEIETHAGLSGFYSAQEGCKGKALKHGLAVGGYLALDAVQFLPIARMGCAKGIMTGTAHGSYLHQLKTYASAYRMGMTGNYREIFLNRALRTVTEGAVQSLKRPDVAGVLKNGVVDIVEVVSKSQTVPQMTAKIASMLRTLGNRAGSGIVIP